MHARMIILQFFLLVATVSGAPSLRNLIPVPSCDISNAKLALPQNQTALAEPAASTSFIGLAIGVQNYTCSNTSTYTNVGAVAELLDLSCAYDTPAFASVQDTAYTLWSTLPSSVPTTQNLISLVSLTPLNSYPVLGQHYYTLVNGSTTASPKWDFTSSGAYAGNASAYVIGAKVGDLPAPEAAGVDWVSLKAVQGELASQVYRVETRGGLAPASCTPGSPPISVKYTAKYWLFGGSIKN